MLQKSNGTFIRSIMESLKDTRSELFWVEWLKLLGHAGTVNVRDSVWRSNR